MYPTLYTMWFWTTPRTGSIVPAMTRGQPTGNKRLRGDSWQLRVYAGVDPATGKTVELSLTVPPKYTPDGYTAVSPEEADIVLAKLAAKARAQQAERRAQRHLARAAAIFEELGQ